MSTPVFFDDNDLQYILSTCGSDELQKLIKFYIDNFTCLGYGRHRITFDNGDGRVVKLPKRNDDIYFDANREEHKRFLEEGPEKLAACTLETIDGFPVLYMEKVEVLGCPHRYPDIAILSTFTDEQRKWLTTIDCKQVGYTSDGRLVAYDYTWV